MDEMPIELELKGLVQGANLPLEMVKNKICPNCSFKTPFCDFMMGIKEKAQESGTRFVYNGMRYWLGRGN